MRVECIQTDTAVYGDGGYWVVYGCIVGAIPARSRVYIFGRWCYVGRAGGESGGGVQSTS